MILIVAPRLEVGGTEFHLLRVLPALRRRGIDVAVFVLKRGGRLEAQFVAQGVPVTGYDGGGTEDLFVVWRKWYPAKLRINTITHCPCDHVIWEKKKGGDEKTFTLIRSFHETEGECVGHLRTAKMPWKEF